MADNLCGPSNPTKGLARVFDQDRYREAARTSAPQNPIAERFSAQNPTAAGTANASFSNFQSTQPSLNPYPAGVSGLSVPGPQHHAAGFGRPVGQAMPFAPAHGLGRGAGQAAHGGWAQEFMQGSHTHGQQQQVMNGGVMNGGPTFAQQGPMANYGMNLAATPWYMAPNANMNNPQAHGQFTAEPNKVSEQELHAAIDAEFEKEMARWATAQANMNAAAVEEANFKKEEEKWMAAQPEIREWAQTAVDTAPSGHPDNLTSRMDALNLTQAEQAAAAASSSKTQDQSFSNTELAQAAQQLVNAVQDNESEKFRKSNFLEMMRRIAAEEIIVHDNNLVEASSVDMANAGNDRVSQVSDLLTDSALEDKTSVDYKGKGKAAADYGSAQFS